MGFGVVYFVSGYGCLEVLCYLEAVEDVVHGFLTVDGAQSDFHVCSLQDFEGFYCA